MMKGGANGADGKGLLPMFALKPWFGIKVIKFQKKVKKRRVRVDRLQLLLYNIKLYPYRIDRIRKVSRVVYLSLLYNENKPFTS